MEIIYEDKTQEAPDLTPKIMTLKVKNVPQIIGVELDALKVVQVLRRVRLGAEMVDEHEVKVEVPAFRIDLLHEVDLIENVAVGYDFRKIGAVMPELFTVASEDIGRVFDKRLRDIMVGMGFLEVMSLMLTSEEQHYHKMGVPEDERVTVAQPISKDRTMIRKSLLNGLLEFLEDNKHEELPQKIFEVGETVFIDKKAETHTRGVKKLAALITHSSANFTEIKSVTHAFISNLGVTMDIQSFQHPSFIKGRCAKLSGIKSDTKSSKSHLRVEGFFGELNPEVITNFELEYPVVGFEVEFKGV